MLKTLSIIALILFPVVSFAIESTGVKCDSGNDCFDKSYYLLDQKNDFEKSFKYAKKGCDQYNHGSSCLISCMTLMKKEGFSSRNVQERFVRSAELGVPGAILGVYVFSPAYQDFKSHIINKSMKEFYHSSNAVDKFLELNEVFLKVCTIQSKLKKSSDEREKKYFTLSRDLIKGLTKDVYLEWGKDEATFPNAEGEDISISLYNGFVGIQDGNCDGLNKGIKLLNEFKKYEDL